MRMNLTQVNLTTGTGLYMGPCVGQTGSVLGLGFPICVYRTHRWNPFDRPTTQRSRLELLSGRPLTKISCMLGEALGQEARGKGLDSPVLSNQFKKFPRLIRIHRHQCTTRPGCGPLGRKPRGDVFGKALCRSQSSGYWSSPNYPGYAKHGSNRLSQHFIGYEQEMYRMTTVLQEGYSSNIDDRTLHELYLWPFAEGVRAGVGSIMMAYNQVGYWKIAFITRTPANCFQVNSSLSSQNSLLINGILKAELGFQGFVVTIG